MAANTLPSDAVDRVAGVISPAASRLRTLSSGVAGPIRPTAFWFAVLLPFTYVPMLASGFATDHAAAFLVLLASNVLAFVLGHSHNQSRSGHDA
jgi:hypothetical protein